VIWYAYHGCAGQSISGFRVVRRRQLDFALGRFDRRLAVLPQPDAEAAERPLRQS
jgi:hypothetical protein